MKIELGDVGYFYLWRKGDYRSIFHILDIWDEDGNLIEVYMDDKDLQDLRDAIE